jgi:hypothetical protein
VQTVLATGRINITDGLTIDALLALTYLPSARRILLSGWKYPVGNK